MKSFKGFNKNLQCRGMQYEIGKTYEEQEAKVCNRGLHSCEYPLDVFNYYAPNDSRYCEVEADGKIDKEDDGDSKIASTKLHIGLEIGIKGIVEAGVKFILDRVDWKNAKESNDQDQSAATNTGYRSAAIVEGKESVAMSIGYEGKAKGALGCWIVLAEWFNDDEEEYHIKDVKSTKVDGEIIKENIFYTLKDGKFVETE
ncbi:MAG: hypothetical protein Q8936_01895 [Bacillota bacterium]|nr:hypothetical protein [Bacillota bacterium]